MEIYSAECGEPSVVGGTGNKHNKTRLGRQAGKGFMAIFKAVRDEVGQIAACRFERRICPYIVRFLL